MQAQKQTIEAFQAMNQGKWETGRKLIAKSRDPLAAKIYYWLYFTKGPKEQRFIRLAQFVHQNPHWPGIRTLRIRAEKTISDTMPLKDILAWFQAYPPLTTDGVDKYTSALIAQGRAQDAKNVISNWWASTPLNRDQQKEMYRKYSYMMDAAIHRKRLDTLLFAKQYNNARAIAEVLGNGHMELVEARIALSKNKPNVEGYLTRVPRTLQSDPGLLFERARWRRRHDMNMRALDILHRTPPVQNISNPGDWWHEKHILIRRFLEKGHYESAYLLASTHVQKAGLSFAQAEWMAGWLSLRFLNNAPRALQHFEVLYAGVKSPISMARASYWAGRAAEEIGSHTIAQKWYQKAAKYQTTFYGQLAGEKLGADVQLTNAAPPILTAQDKDGMERAELLQAARLFSMAGMRKDSSSFLRAFVAHENTPQAYRYAAEVASDLKQYHDAVYIAKRATKKGLFLTKQAYPTLLSEMNSVRVEWALAHAIIRQESMFDFAAQSPAGALGLMQLMPATAKQVARERGYKHTTALLTQNPSHNIRLGTAYLEKLSARFDGAYPLVVAAYNAGPGRVDKWLKIYGDPRKGEIDLIDWVELIPIYETRNYVQRVLEGIYIYRLRLIKFQKNPESDIHVAASSS